MKHLEVKLITHLLHCEGVEFLKLYFYFPYPLLVVILNPRDIDIKFVRIFSVDFEDVRKAIPPERWLIYPDT
jgi:hypothetical protein